MDSGQIVLLIVVIVIVLGAVGLAVLYADYADRRTKSRRRSEHESPLPRVIPSAPPPPQPPPVIDFGESAPPVRADKIRWGEAQPPRKVSRTDRLDSKRFVHCPICRQSITAQDIERGRLTACRNCQTQYHTDCLSYANNVCPMCRQA